MADYDIVVLGGGPGGYATALYAASAGLSVALVEADKVGGTCLHRGCIPAKALLHAAEVFRTVNHAGEHGVKLPAGVIPEPDWPAANKRKAGIVGNLHKGLQGLLKRRKVNVVIGWGRLTADGAVAVTAEGGGNADAVRPRRDRLRRVRAARDPGHGHRRRQGRHLRPEHEQRRGDAARAGRGDRRRRDRGGVRLGLHGPGREDHAPGGPAQPDPAARPGPRRREHPGPLADPARPDGARRGPGRLARAHRLRGRRAVRDTQGLRQDRGRPGAGLDRAPPGDRGPRRRRGRGEGLGPRLHRGRPEHHAHLPARASTRSATASTPRGWRTSPTPRPSSR